jgi:hypothetical protein
MLAKSLKIAVVAMGLAIGTFGMESKSEAAGFGISINSGPVWAGYSSGPVMYRSYYPGYMPYRTYYAPRPVYYPMAVPHCHHHPHHCGW